MSLGAVVLSDAAADAAGKRVRVESVALDAVDELGENAPLAVLDALADDVPLRRIVEQLRAGTLPPSDDARLVPVSTRQRGGSAAGIAVATPGDVHSGLPAQGDEFGQLLDLVGHELESLTSADASDVQAARADAARQHEEVTGQRGPVADPRVFVQRAQRRGVDDRAGMLVAGILLAAHAGYSEAQIEELLFDRLLAGRPIVTQADLLAFLLAGTVPDEEPSSQPTKSVFKRPPLDPGAGNADQQGTIRAEGTYPGSGDCTGVDGTISFAAQADGTWTLHLSITCAGTTLEGNGNGSWDRATGRFEGSLTQTVAGTSQTLPIIGTIDTDAGNIAFQAEGQTVVLPIMR